MYTAAFSICIHTIIYEVYQSTKRRTTFWEAILISFLSNSSSFYLCLGFDRLRLQRVRFVAIGSQQFAVLLVEFVPVLNADLELYGCDTSIGTTQHTNTQAMRKSPGFRRLSKRQHDFAKRQATWPLEAT